MGRLRSMPLQRYESSGNLDKGESNEIFCLAYSGNSATDDLDAANRASLSNLGYAVTNKPVIIYQYDATIIWGGPAGAIWQFYGDDDDRSSMNAWDMEQIAFQDGMRNKKFIGATPPFSTTSEHAPNFKVYTLKFKARKNPRKMRAKYGKWAVKPIVLGPHSQNTFGFSVVNLQTGAGATSYDNARHYTHIELKRWQTEF